LRQAEASVLIKEFGRKHDLRDASEVKRLREAPPENGKLKRLLAEAHQDIHALKSAFGTKR
jgi:putative transposase